MVKVKNDSMTMHALRDRPKHAGAESTSGHRPAATSFVNRVHGDCYARQGGGVEWEGSQTTAPQGHRVGDVVAGRWTRELMLGEDLDDVIAGGANEGLMLGEGLEERVAGAGTEESTL